MNEKRIEMDAAFFTAFAKDKNINRAEFNAAWIKSHATKTEKPKIEFVGKTEEQKKVFKVLENYCNNFPCTPSNVILCGATGTGKTFAANLMKQSLQQKKVWVEYTTAFSMVNTFQKYVNSFGRDDEDLENFLNCEVLIIDDLGAEPIIKNVTQEHIYNIINERLYNGLAFIITTNLTPQQIMERYDQRIASRILSKENSTIIEFKGKDLRI